MGVAMPTARPSVEVLSLRPPDPAEEWLRPPTLAAQTTRVRTGWKRCRKRSSSFSAIHMDASRDELDRWLAEKAYNFTEQELEDSFSRMSEKNFIMCEVDHIFFVM